MEQILKEKILLLDGAMGTQIQKYDLKEDDYRGDFLKNKCGEFKGNNDLLCLTRPDVICEIHKSYLQAGANIITTCTFNANCISQHEYGCEDLVEKINFAGAQIARIAVDEYAKEHPDIPLFVAGSVGPTTKLLSLSDDSDNPAYRSITFQQLRDAYTVQISSLIQGGVDIILIETVLDPINAKAALEAAQIAMDSIGRKVPVMLSATVTDANGYLLSGQSIEAFVIAMEHARPLSIGFNCSVGASQLIGPLRRLAQISPFYISVHPNAGLPNQLGEYDDTPDAMASMINQFIDENLVNIVGGCCGTTPEHIAKFREVIDACQGQVHIPASPSPALRLSGLQPLISSDVFVNIGERCNVAGSRKFLRLIKEKNYAEAVEIARKQIEDGAMAIDINMDDGLICTKEEMLTFLNILSTEPEIAKVPIMIDSSKFDVIEAALECLQGKGIVNSISLKEGEEKFLEHARAIQRLGAAVVVMAFDEEGQATSFQRRKEVCQRAYSLLVNKAGFNPYDIIFDPNILTVATGMEQHLDYAYDFVRTAHWIKENLPGARVSGGLSNLSFAFRGNNLIREAMHAVFLYRAVQEGMDMAIMNPATAMSYEDVPPELYDAIEAVLFSERTIEATERLITLAAQLSDKKEEHKEEVHESLSVEQRLCQALIKGNPSNLDSELAEALTIFSTPIDIIAGPLMKGMNLVGEMFGDGRMFLPQVVKTARTMKRAVEILQPEIEKALSNSDASAPTRAGKVLLATVKGDVHDIGKNIVGVVLSCNNYEVIDLGVMVSPEKIIETVKEEKPDFVCLSGLITPSLDAMVETVSRMKQAGITVPVMIGGATTSQMHTAVRIAPAYDGPVIYVRDASQNPIIASKLLSPSASDFILENKKLQEDLRIKFEHKENHEANRNAQRLMIDWKDYQVPSLPLGKASHKYFLHIQDLMPCIDWLYFYHAWRVKEDSQQGQLLRNDAESLLQELSSDSEMGCIAVLNFYQAHGTDKSIIFDDENISIDTPRQSPRADDKPALSLCDFVHPEKDYVGVFATTVSQALCERLERAKTESDDYKSLLLQTLMDRLAEAASEWLHRQFNWDTIRPAIGYPSLPRQKEIFKLSKLLRFDSLGIKLTESGAMYPQASVAGIYISHPQAKYFIIENQI